MENQRIRLSKKMLKEAMLRLLQKKEIQQISIQEICQEAQINRTTFYKYYGSQYELLNDIENDFLNELEKCLIGCEPFSPYSENDGLTQTLAYFESEREKCLMMLKSTTDKEFAEKLFSLPVIHNLIKKNISQDYTEKQAKYVHTFITNGGYAIIRQWANSENRETPQEMSRIIQKMMSKLLLS